MAGGSAAPGVVDGAFGRVRGNGVATRDSSAQRAPAGQPRGGGGGEAGIYSSDGRTDARSGREPPSFGRPGGRGFSSIQQPSPPPLALGSPRRKPEYTA